MLAADCPQSVFFWIPQASGFFIVEDKSVLIGPARWCQGQNLSIELAAVHSREINQRSVPGNDGLAGQGGIGNLVISKTTDCIGMGVVTN